MIATYQITGQHLPTVPNEWGLPESFEKLGWQGYVDETIKPDLEWGVRRILLQNPFCCPRGWYQFDQAIHATNAKLPTVKGFVEAIRPLVKQGIEVIGYLGTRADDRDFEKRKAAFQGDNYLQRWIDSQRLLLDAGCSIGNDYSNNLDPKSVEFLTMSAARAALGLSGAKSYIEPAPSRECPHLWDWDNITQDHWFNEHRDWWADLKHITGEIIRWVDRMDFGGTVSQVAGRLAERFYLIQKEGHTPAGIVGFLRQAGYRFEEFSSVTKG